MKKILIAFIFVFVVSTLAFAHPPSDIKISYDTTTGALEILIIHPVSIPDSHYIKKAEIRVNGKKVTELKFSRQENNAAQSIIYSLPNLKLGDIISVEAYCSISGKLEREIRVFSSGKN